MDSRVFRGRAARARGRRFELWCRKKFLGEGFGCERREEIDYPYGHDLLLFKPGVVGPLPVAIQCKCSLRKSDLMKGLREAERGWPTSKLAICIHALRTQDVLHSELKLVLSFPGRDPPFLLRPPTWESMISVLNRRLFGDLRDGRVLP